MTDKEPSTETTRETLRIILDKRGTECHDKMLERLKAANEFVKVHPSELVSFLVADYFETYFERDIEVLVAEFFDSRSYLTGEIQSDENLADPAEAMKRATAFVEQIRSKRRGQTVRRGRRKSTVTTANETV
jgi:hypothetical protein